MMNFDCDVLIVGAGPVGSTIAYQLGKNGLDVVIVEKKKQIGYPLQCAGILSKHIFSFNDLPDEIILNKVKGAFLHTQNHILNVEKESEVAYVIDRIAYDEFLLNRAVENGVKLINQKAIDFDVENGIVYLSDNKKIQAKIIIGCDGYNSVLSQKMGNEQLMFNASQMLVRIDEVSVETFRDSKKNINDYVDTYIMEEILPGFIWNIPVGNDHYRVGLFSQHSHKKQDEILTDFLNNHFEYEIIEKYKGFIPIFNEKNIIVRKRAILIGDAAAQVKPTSGGGLLLGFDGCNIASRYVLEAIESEDIDILKCYEKQFNKKYLREFNYQFKVQKTLNLLSDKDLDYLFLKLKENDCEKLISDYGDMDTQSTLVKEFIKRGLLFKIIPTFLFKKITNIFGFR